ncbi:translation initiation factor eIF 4e-like domain-containing protein [Macrophomina phaseolina]|uniref:Translation initiation factor eIF 4e-like domain-containing protein n=1 Tax=Macrophomina phaseolina TaxID=35725 RepID=A0ABQ8GAN9_9PEZI|nr:translation initiation factor eIF 4e-like domain-containing protein [Macrophomina phaseolina]
MSTARPTIPGLNTNGLPPQSENDAAATNSPARGKAMKEALLQKLRPPPLEHTWEFWHDRQGRENKPAWAQEEDATTNPDSPADKVNESNEYESRLVKLHVIRDLRQFWETMNHFDLSTLRLRDSVHLFHLGVKPVWEDPRNLKGGAWTFRVPKEKAAQFWKEVALMAIGGELQSAVDNSAKRHTFIDDICGISYSVRFNSHLISIWNRDAENQEGIDRLRDTVLGGISSELTLRDNQYYYKRHSEHAGFRFPDASQQKEGQ